MADYGEWNRKGATLSDVTALKKYGVDQKFIVGGINAGRLEYREGAIWGNPYIRVLRSQLEQYIVEQLGSDYLTNRNAQTELANINREISTLKKDLAARQKRKAELEVLLGNTSTDTTKHTARKKSG